jgi:choline dehydrogenase-like flavoprotein
VPLLDYDEARSPRALNEHLEMTASFKSALLGAGMLSFTRRIGVAGTAHASGTLVAGDDPADSVVDGSGKVYGLESLYVVDGSVLPRSSRVNPSLTIFAWSLRASALLARELSADRAVMEAV